MIIWVLFHSTLVWSQDNKLKSSDLYQKSKDYIVQKEYSNARKALRILLERKPKDIKYRVIIARTYLWEKKFEKVDRQIDKILLVDKDNKAAYVIWLKSKIWRKDQSGAMVVVNKATSIWKHDEYFQLEKAKLLVKSEKEEEAIAILKVLVEKNPSNKDAVDLLRSLKAKFAKNRIGAQYLFNYYSNTPENPLHGIALRYHRATKIGSFILKSNHYNRFDKWGHQIELDAYPRLFKGVYAYANIGYSYTDLFPVYRAGFEPFFKLPKSFEGSVGFRYLDFESSTVAMYTASLGKYFKSNWLNLRTFITPKEDGVSKSVSLEFRHFTKDANNFYFARTGMGASPDAANLNVDLEKLIYTPSYKVAIGASKTFQDKWYASVSLGGENQVFTDRTNLLLTAHITVDYAF